MTEERDDLVADRAAPPAERLRAARELIAQGMGAGLLEQLRDLAPQHAAEIRKLALLANYVRRTSRELDFAGDRRWQSLDGQAPGTARESTGVLLWLHPGARRVVLAFSNLNGGFGMMSGWPSIGLIQRELKPLATNVVYLLDSTRLLHFAGIHGLGADYPGCIAALTNLLEERGWTERFAFGASAGGFAALRYGLDLEARGVLSLSGPTSLDLADPTNRISSWEPIQKTLPDYAVDLLPLYRARPRRPRLLLCYGALHKKDAMDAQRMTEFPETELIPFEGLAGHSTLMEALRRRNLGELTARLMRL